MLKTVSVMLPLLAAVAAGPALAGGPDGATSTTNPAADTQARAPKSADGVLVTVNGTLIGEEDVRFALSSGGHKNEVPPGHRKNVLEVIIRRELISQEAIELGLDANAGYREKLRRMEAQINAFKREELSKLFRRDIAKRAEISEAEAKKYFAENATRIRTELHVWQILHREEGLIEQALKDIEHGAPFEEVARAKFPKLPKTVRTPWDLPSLRWQQVPTPWRSVVYDLEKGEASGVIRGPNSRYWIIQLIDKRVNPDITFEAVKPTIVEVLKNERIEDLQEKAERRLKAKASIVYSKEPVEVEEE